VTHTKKKSKKKTVSRLDIFTECMLREAKYCALKSPILQLYGVFKADTRDHSGYGKILLLLLAQDGRYFRQTYLTKLTRNSTGQAEIKLSVA